MPKLWLGRGEDRLICVAWLCRFLCRVFVVQRWLILSRQGKENGPYDWWVFFLGRIGIFLLQVVLFSLGLRLWDIRRISLQRRRLLWAGCKVLCRILSLITWWILSTLTQSLLPVDLEVGRRLNNLLVVIVEWKQTFCLRRALGLLDLPACRPVPRNPRWLALILIWFDQLFHDKIDLLNILCFWAWEDWLR